MLDAIAGFFALPGYLVLHRGEHAFFWLYPVCAIVAAFVVCARPACEGEGG